MRVLQVMAGDSVGGAETFFVDSIKAFHETQHKQCVITRDNNKHKLRRSKSAASLIKPHPSRMSGPSPRPKSCARRLRNLSPTLSIITWAAPALSASPASTSISAGMAAITSQNALNTASITPQSRKTSSSTSSSRACPRKNAHLLHIYAEFAQGNERSIAAHWTPPTTPRSSSRFRACTRKKGLDVLLEALVTVPDAYLWIAGSGPMEKQLKQQTKDLKLEERVRFLGWRNDQADLLATADVIAFPSRYEPFGAVVIEAWAGKKPLVTARAKGPAAYVRHEENGLIVDIDDVDASPGRSAA